MHATPNSINAPKVLVVDDDEDLLIVIQLALSAEGFEVSRSTNGNSLFEILDKNPPDLILLDITMEGVNGKDLCLRIKADEHSRNIPVLMFSANRNIEEITKHCGADGYVAKPFEIKDLVAKINTYISN